MVNSEGNMAFGLMGAHGFGRDRAVRECAIAPVLMHWRLCRHPSHPFPVWKAGKPPCFAVCAGQLFAHTAKWESFAFLLFA